MKPEKVLRIGSVSASIFVNEVDAEGGKRKLRNVNLQRRYRDGDEWKSTSSFGLGDLPQAIEVLRPLFLFTPSATIGPWSIAHELADGEETVRIGTSAGALGGHPYRSSGCSVAGAPGDRSIHPLGLTGAFVSRG